ncbi:MAG TPA: hypothetical protein PK874_12420 [Desulfobacteraceae bacterium]|nr:hypothetical protein [Desulfobacteraceae bacterium]HPJ68766.1 hypothetical protein [Desulfobacteraceae bacterium]
MLFKTPPPLRIPDLRLELVKLVDISKISKNFISSRKDILLLHGYLMVWKARFGQN